VQQQALAKVPACGKKNSCRDRQVLAALKTGAARTLKTVVSIANGKGQKWVGYHPDDIHLEAVSISPDDRNAVI
jgi:hypothetical protein